MKPNRFLIQFSALFLISTAILSETQRKPWTILVFMEADNNLSPFALKNLYDISSIEANENVNVLVQWNQEQKKGIWRYKVEKRRAELDSHFNADFAHNSVHALVDAVRWAKEKAPFENLALVLWNHGYGIIDPIWTGTSHSITPKFSPKELVISGDTVMDRTVTDRNETLSEDKRAILFNESTKTYMSNQQLSESLKIIKEELGKDIDLIGMDACLMAMTETAYQIRKYAKILVASQEVELGEGWHYSPFLRELVLNKLDCFELSKIIVSSYADYYKNRTQYFTQSAIKLEHSELLRQSIDVVVTLLQECKAVYPEIKTLVANARMRALQFNTPSYVDLHSLLHELYRQINGSCLNSDNIDVVMRLPQEQESRQPALTGPLIEQLKNHLLICMKIVEDMVVANATGKHLLRAKGISIYFPRNRIDSSYIKTDFAQESLWLEFLKDYV